MEPEDLEYEARGISRRGFIAATASAALLLAMAPAASARATTIVFNHPFTSPRGTEGWALGTDHGGTNTESKGHTGRDLTHTGGSSTVYAVAAGTVISVNYLSYYGNYVVIAHADGWYSRYQHLAAGSIAPLGPIAQSGFVGTIGSTGSIPGQPIGTHLHIAMWASVSTSGAPIYVEPSYWIQNAPFPGSPGALPATPETPMEELMSTDVLYWVGTGSPATTLGLKSPATTVTQDSLWYQECVGAPLFKLSNTVLNSPNSATNLPLEYRAFEGVRNRALATRTEVTTTQLAALIDLRGEAAAPQASLAPLRT